MTIKQGETVSMYVEVTVKDGTMSAFVQLGKALKDIDSQYLGETPDKVCIVTPKEYTGKNSGENN